MNGWIGVDLDGTLAEHYWPEKGAYHPHRIGDPVPPMVARVKHHLDQGHEVRIFTARMDGGGVSALDPRVPRDHVALHNEVEVIRAVIGDWTERHVGVRLDATCIKDYGMIMLYDDRAIRIIQNKGVPCCIVPHDE